MFYTLSTQQRYKQSALRKKELITFFGERSTKEAVIMDSFVEHLEKIHENIKA